MVRVTIGLPVYNGQNYLSQAIESVLAQTYTDWELVISDNASTDATAQIAQRYAAQDSRIRFLRAEQNRGAAWNFNEVFKLGNGELFRWLSHDDVLAPTAIERCVESLDQNPEAILCCTQTGVIDSEGYQVWDAEHSTGDLAFQGLTWETELRRRQLCASRLAIERFRGILLYSIRCYEVYGLIRRDVMQRTQLHPSYCGGEKVLLAELALFGPFVELDESLFYCRWHDERFSSLDSAREQIAHMDPLRTVRIPLPHQYRATLGYMQLVFACPLTLAERLSGLMTCLRFTLQFRKWSTILWNTLTGQATAAATALPTRRGGRVCGDIEEHNLHASKLDEPA